MKGVLVPIDKAGRIALPKNIREKLGIKPGDLFVVSIHGATITLTPNKEKTGFIRKGRALVFSTGVNQSLRQETIKAILEAGREERTFRVIKKITGRKRKQ